MKTGIIVITNGDKCAEAILTFEKMLERLSNRLSKMEILPAFLTLQKPDLESQIKKMAKNDYKKIIIFPYFLEKINIQKDIPQILEIIETEFFTIEFVFLDSLGNDFGLEDLIIDRLFEHFPLTSPKFITGKNGVNIETESHKTIDLCLEHLKSPELDIYRRVIHASADFSYVRSLRIHEKAIEIGIKSLQANNLIFTDVQMLASGITHGPKVICAVSNSETLQKAKIENITRSAAAMDILSSQYQDCIVAVGNAPTALARIISIFEKTGKRPALVIGLPVGLVGAAESKMLLLKSKIPYITNIGRKGGTAVAAAVVNALTILAK